MRYYVWIVDANQFDFIKAAGGVSDSYIIPKQHLFLATGAEMAGATIWIVMRTNRADIPFASVHISKVEQYEEGLSRGDYLLTIDPSKSLRAISNLEQANRHASAQFSKYPIGITSLGVDIARRVRQEVLDRVGIKLINPPNLTLGLLEEPSMNGTNTLRAKRLIASISEHLSLGEVWGSGPPNRFPPFANFAYHKVLQKLGRAAADDLAQALIRQDPCATRDVVANKNTESDLYYVTDEATVPFVDVQLAPIEIGKIYARKFIAKEESAINIQEILDKVGDGEKAHQDMLREIATRLQFLKQIPLQSRSIDLSVLTRAGFVIFELKTAHKNNVLSQVAKGLLQLVCYRDALLEESKMVAGSVLILHSFGSEAMQRYLEKIARYSNIKVLFYDLSADWPNRVIGLEEIVLHRYPPL